MDHHCDFGSLLTVKKKECQKIVISQNDMNEAEKQELSDRFIYSFVDLGLRI
jgi:hypothetical protein